MTRSGATSISARMIGITSSQGFPALEIFSLSESITQKLPRLSSAMTFCSDGSSVPAAGFGRPM